MKSDGYSEPTIVYTGEDETKTCGPCLLEDGETRIAAFEKRFHCPEEPESTTVSASAVACAPSPK